MASNNEYSIPSIAQDRPTTVRELARRAARLIDKRGLAKNHLTITNPLIAKKKGCPVGSVCVRGAMNLAMNGEAYSWDHGLRRQVEAIMINHPLVRKRADMLEFDGFDGYYGTVQFNNHPDTQKEDVIKVLQSIADGHIN